MQHNIIPQVMRVETINVCNESCVFCPYPDLEREKGKMSEDLFRKILSEHSKVDNPKLLFPANVGEPLLDKRLPHLIAIASKEYGYTEIASFTNATMLDSEVAENLIKSGLSEIMFTLHGLKEEDFVRITGFKDYNKVKNNIKDFILLNTAFNKPVKIFLDIYSKYSKDEVLSNDLVKLAINHGVHLTFEPLINTHNWGGKKTEEKKIRNIGCGRIYRQFGVLYNGDISPCCVDTEGAYLFGNAFEKSLEDIFSGEMRRNMVEKEKNKELHKISLCKYCDMDCHKRVEPEIVMNSSL